MKQKILLLIFFLSSQIFSQTEEDSIQTIIPIERMNLFSTNLRQEINTYNFNSNLVYNYNKDDFFVIVKEKYASTLIKFQDKSIKDEQYLTLIGGRKVSYRSTLGLNINNDILSDSRKIEINNSSNSIASLFFQYEPIDELKITPFGGLSNNRQIGESDNGAVYGLEINLSPIFILDSEIKSYLNFKNDDILPRRNNNRKFLIGVSNNIDDNINNILNLNYSSTRREYYFPANQSTMELFSIINNIQIRNESIYRLENLFTYNSSEIKLGFSLLSGISFREITKAIRYKNTSVQSSIAFDNRINETKIDLESQFNYSFSSVNTMFKVLYSGRNEEYNIENIPGINEIFFNERSELEKSKNNISNRIFVSLSGNWLLTSNQKIFVNLSQNKLRYDTPSLLNVDDRDELLSIIQLKYFYKLNPFFEFFVGSEANLNHLVYISSQRSSNNYINRVLKFTTGGIYSGAILTNVSHFDISANYTDYTYDYLTSGISSFSFRQLTLTDSLLFKFSNNYSSKLYTYLKYSEQGELNWKSFSMKPMRFLREVFLFPELIYNFNNGFCGIGIRYFELATFSFNKAQKEIKEKFSSLAPALNLLWGMKNSFIKFSGYYEFITMLSGQKKNQINFIFESGLYL